jgi:hypothetical protein
MANRKAVVDAGPNDQVVELTDGDELKDVRYGRWSDNPKGRETDLDEAEVVEWIAETKGGLRRGR